MPAASSRSSPTSPPPTPRRGLPTAVDVLVNNAGIQHVAPGARVPPRVFERIHRVMLLAPFRLARHVLPHMYATGWGRVVNVSSVHGLRASPFKSAYVSAKHGLEGLSKVIALEGAEHGRDEQLRQPGLRAHPAGGEADRRPGEGARHPRVRGPRDRHAGAARPASGSSSPSEVAAFASFLCTSDADSITGASLTMDGGWTAH